MADPFTSTREQVAGAALLVDAEAGLLGDDPLDHHDFRQARKALTGWEYALDALLMARGREDGDAIAETQMQYRMSFREVRQLIQAIATRWAEDEKGA